MSFPENYFRIAVCLCLVIPGKVQVDIRLFVPFESKEGLKRNVESGFDQLCPAVRTLFIRHIKSASACKCTNFFGIKITVMTITAVIMRTERIHLRNPRHGSHKRRPYRTAGSYQIAIIVGFPYQLLGNDVHHGISIGNNRSQFPFQPGLHRFWQFLPVNLMGFVIADIPQVLL